MKLTFWGAAQTVTGSLHSLELKNGTRLFLDCGLYQGYDEDITTNHEWPCDPSTVKAVLLSHAHIDHSALLPKLYRDGFRGTIYATHATRDLLEWMLRDSAYIQESDADFYNRKIRDKGEPKREPLYTMEDAEGVLGLFTGVSLKHPFVPVQGVMVEYFDAGHILGSAAMVLTAKEGETTKRLGFTGDIGNPGRPILRDPWPLPEVDWLISESTYGGEEHEPVDQAKSRLEDVIGRTVGRGGKVVIPAFAVGRTQELVHYLDQLQNEGKLPDIPVYVDSPLAVNVTAVFRSHPECYDRDLVTYMLTDPNPFGFERLTYIRDVEDSKALNGMTMPFIVMSTSGMADHGRVQHHLRNTITDHRNAVLIVGYQAEGSRGRKIAERHETISIFGDDLPLNAEVEVMETFSAHADQPGILEYFGKIEGGKPKTVFLVHGEPEKQKKLESALREEGYGDVRIPKRGDVVSL